MLPACGSPGTPAGDKAAIHAPARHHGRAQRQISVEAAVAAVAFLPGLAIGSFLNVVASRVPLHRPLNGRSACMSCAAPIAWYDNVPLVSYLVLRGRCRS